MNTIMRFVFGGVLFASISSVFADDKPPPPLSEKQQTAIRRAAHGRTIVSASGGPGIEPGRTYLVVPSELSEIYTVNRLGTLKLLAEIVEKGEPRDAILALAYMKALEGKLVGGAVIARTPVKDVDDDEDSFRATMIKLAKEMVEKVANPKMVPPTPPQFRSE
jgi:hypothetical protein